MKFIHFTLEQITFRFSLQNSVQFKCCWESVVVGCWRIWKRDQVQPLPQGKWIWCKKNTDDLSQQLSIVDQDMCSNREVNTRVRSKASHVSTCKIKSGAWKKSQAETKPRAGGRYVKRRDQAWLKAGEAAICSVSLEITVHIRTQKHKEVRARICPPRRRSKGESWGISVALVQQWQNWVCSWGKRKKKLSTVRRYFSHFLSLKSKTMCLTDYFPKQVSMPLVISSSCSLLMFTDSIYHAQYLSGRLINPKNMWPTDLHICTPIISCHPPVRTGVRPYFIDWVSFRVARWLACGSQMEVILSLWRCLTISRNVFYPHNWGNASGSVCRGQGCYQTLKSAQESPFKMPINWLKT
jgi:hypothetical protein